MYTGLWENTKKEKQENVYKGYGEYRADIGVKSTQTSMHQSV